MLNNINNYSFQQFNNNFKSEQQKKFDLKRTYFIGDKKKRIKGYTIAGIATALSLPLLYNLELKSKPKHMSLKSFNKRFSLITAAVVLPIIAIILMQEKANYLHDKQSKVNNDTFTKNPQGV